MPLQLGRWTLDFGLWTEVLSLDHRAGATPARIEEKVRDGVAVGSAFIVRPIHKHRSPDHILARYKTPVAAVFAVFTIVTHDKVFVLGHN